MRTYGRIIPDILYPDIKKWVVVTTDPNGYNDGVWLTTLIQCLKLNLGESPFFANYGIPAHPSVVQQIPPDLYSAITQQQFAQYFASLIITRVTGALDPFEKLPRNAPTYNVRVITNFGSVIDVQVPT